MLRLIALVLVIFCETPKSALAEQQEPWVTCSYNGRSIRCQRSFLCKQAPCNSFSLTWADGAKDTYKLVSRSSRTSATYSDSRGGKWNLLAYAGSFILRNPANGNTIIFDGSFSTCKNEWQFGDLCGKR
jgi:hypothetical protein